MEIVFPSSFVANGSVWGNELVTVRARCRGLSLPLEYELHA